MNARILDGRLVASELLAETTTSAERYRAEAGRMPCLATVLVGDDPASHSYVQMKVNRCLSVGIHSRRIDLPSETSTQRLVDVVSELSADDSVDGILLQHPVPAQIDERAGFEAIHPGKDVDGVTRTSFASMAFGLGGFESCTPGGILRLLDAYQVPLRGQRAVVVGRSPILGLPVGMLLLARDATVTYCHSLTSDLREQVLEADVLVAAVGRPGLIPGEWIKPGAVVVDAGYSPGAVGDVEFAAAAERASLITPVPGGVGPMTIAVLLAQTLDAALARNNG